MAGRALWQWSLWLFTTGDDHSATWTWEQIMSHSRTRLIQQEVHGHRSSDFHHLHLPQLNIIQLLRHKPDALHNLPSHCGVCLLCLPEAVFCLELCVHERLVWRTISILPKWEWFHILKIKTWGFVTAVVTVDCTLLWGSAWQQRITITFFLLLSFSM